MTRQIPYFRFALLLVAVLLLTSVIVLFACAEPQAAAPQSPTPPAASPSPASPAAPAPQVKPAENSGEQAEMPDIPMTLPHSYWGQVTTNTGEPAVDVEVTAWINGNMRGSTKTDANGQYGTDPLAGLPHYLVVTGQNGDVIEFRVDGVVAEETRLGVLQEKEEKYFWQWQQLEPEWQGIYAAAEVNGLDLVYTPAK